MNILRTNNGFFYSGRCLGSWDVVSNLLSYQLSVDGGEIPDRYHILPSILEPDMSIMWVSLDQFNLIHQGI